MIGEVTIDKFEALTNYPLKEFFVDVQGFFSEDFPQIVNFYQGNINTLDMAKIKRLNRLLENSMIITHYFRNKKGELKTVDFWELLTTIEDIKGKLKYSQNIDKFLRSSITTGTGKSGFVYEYTQKDQETLENITDIQLEEENYNNTWIGQALENDLKEKDYSIDGGKNLRLRKQLFQSNLVTTFIDNTIGERIYGRDIKKLLEFKDNDLEVLGYKETVEQTVEILSTLKKNSIPEFPALGVNADLYKGINFSQLNYPSIVRELRRNFASDDLFQNFNVIKIELVEGDIHIEYQIDTKYELTVIKTASL